MASPIRRQGKQMALDVVRLVDVRLDERDVGDARIAAEQVEDRHPAAARANLDQMSHRETSRSPTSEVILASGTMTANYFASGNGHSPVSCQIS